jgi:hypothetical protein
MLSSLSTRCTRRLRHVAMRTGILTVPSTVHTPSATAISWNRTLSTHTVQYASTPVWKVDNPYTGDIVAEVPQLSESDANRLVNTANDAYRGWKNVPLTKRIQLLNKSIQKYSYVHRWTAGTARYTLCTLQLIVVADMNVGEYMCA